MSDTTQTERRRVTLNMGGLVQFLLGGILSQLIFFVAIAIPALVGLRIIDTPSAESVDIMLSVVVSAGIGVVVCAVLGRFVGKRTSAGWALVVGLELQPVWVLYRALSRSPWGLFQVAVAGAHVLAGSVLAFVFWRGRRQRDTSSAQESSMEAELASSV